ncbi:MAG TPA: flagellar hook protein FlgE [Acidothermaceae bacterium]
MSIFGAMFSGVSGLNAQSQSLGMISDNIANVSTVGYKGSVSRFSTLVTTAASKTTFSPGGVQSNTTQLIDRQGLLQASSSPTDVAIVGRGFFVVNESNAPGLGDEFFYTRAGSFNPDQDGFLVNTAGLYLMGWPTDPNGVPNVGNLTSLTSLQPVSVAGIAGSAVTTTTASLGANLPATAANGATETVTVKIFDSLGVEHNLQFTYTKQSANTWRLSVQNPTDAISGTTSGTVAFNGGADLDVVFNGDGTLAGYDTDTDGTVDTGTLPNVAISGWTTGAVDSTIAVNMGTQNQADGLTQYANDFTTYFINQNGVRFGTFSGVTIDENGIVTALFDNGETTAIYKLPLATFANPNGLQAVSGNLYRESDTSGQVLLNEAGTGNAGGVSPNSLESANVDIATEFTNMIITQRAYSASAKIITTADDMIDELIRIKR